MTQTYEERLARKGAYYAAHCEEVKAKRKAYYAIHSEEVRAKRKAYCATHREEIRASSKAYRAAHRDEKNAYNRTWHAAHREEAYVSNKAYRAAHREKLRTYHRAWYAAHREEVLANQRIYNATHREELCAKSRIRGKAERIALRVEVLKHYGEKCACCGERTPEFLEIDHIHGGGGKHRREIGRNKTYHWLKQNNYPPGFQLLCSNCNHAKAFYGKCPHMHITVLCQLD